MNLRGRDFLSVVTVATAMATPALTQTVATDSAASIPALSGSWNHPAFPWFEPPASGPGPVTNRSRWPQQPGDPASRDGRRGRMSVSTLVFVPRHK
jgi:hypothetical protein